MSRPGHPAGPPSPAPPTTAFAIENHRGGSGGHRATVAAGTPACPTVSAPGAGPAQLPVGSPESRTVLMIFRIVLSGTSPLTPVAP